MFKRLSFRNLNIGWKYGLVFAVMFVFMAASAAMVTILINNIEENIETLSKYGDRAINVTEMGSLSRSKSLYITNYLLNPEQKFIDEFEKRNHEFKELAGQLQEQMRTEEQQLLFNKIIENDDILNDLFTTTIVYEIENNNLTSVNYFHERTDELRGENIEMLDQLRGLVKEDHELIVGQSTNSAAVARSMLILSMLLSVVAGGGLLLLISRAISRQLHNVVELSREIADGNLTVESIDYKGTDEIGLLVQSSNEMKMNLSNTIRQVASVAETVSSQSGELTHSAAEVSAGTEQAAATMLQLATGAESQAGHTTEIAAAMATFTSKVQETNASGDVIHQASSDMLEMTDKGSELMESSIKQMEKIDQLVQNAVHNVQGLDVQSQEISKLVSVIKDIAEQTNLLALNAAIEAARAGEHGRGFAVVADEVRKLAEQVALSVKDITSIVLSIQKESNDVAESLKGGYREVEQGTRQIYSTGDTFKKINHALTDMVTGVTVVSENLANIAASSEKMNTAIEEVSAITQQAAAGVEETSASVEQTNSSMLEVADSADHLSTLAEELNELVSKFKF